MEHPSASVSWNDYREMLEQAVEGLPKGVKVVLLADRGFVHTDSYEGIDQPMGLAKRAFD